MCQACIDKPVFTLISKEGLCRKHFLAYFERKVRKTIRVHKLIDKHDLLVVGVSGGKDSLTVLDLLHRIFEQNRDITIQALAIDEGIAGYRDASLERARSFCAERDIPLRVVSYQKNFGFPLDSVVEGRKPCSVCGVLRRNLLNTEARKLGATKLVTGHNLDDEAQSILMNQFRRNVETSARLGPMTGVEKLEGFVPRIKPLYFVTEQEVMTYAFLRGIVDAFQECPYNKVSYRNQVRELLNSFEELYPGSKHAVVNSFMEVLPLLKEKYKGQVTLHSCSRCGEPSSQTLCRKCSVLDEVGAA